MLAQDDSLGKIEEGGHKTLPYVYSFVTTQVSMP